ncbi:hypothetical protein EHO60_14665 [Leptospira fletcheri]|uniref:Outer membrane protein beta-barrel domain-containing protein n=1 Tax=Leptospira fletcheri TaxID=2484981 RepID=A0A4R9GB61_9LEPT|nr:hypothetical protein [Leptospira fletcheri]TGK08595.1 hypothetical protein EHO60_14665 [Leptospira fletcheri]
MKIPAIVFPFLVAVFLSGSLFGKSQDADDASKSLRTLDPASLPIHSAQAERRAANRFFIGGIGADGFVWGGIGVQISGRFALSLQMQEQSSLQRFDLKMNLVPANLSGTFTLTQHERIQRQTGLQFEWFPFSNPYFFAFGAGLESFSEKQRKREIWFPYVSVQEHDWNLNQKRPFLSAGAGLRYLFGSSFFVHFGGNILLYLKQDYHVNRGAYYTSAIWDPTQFQQLWTEPDKEGKSRQSGYGAQIQILLGFYF